LKIIFQKHFQNVLAEDATNNRNDNEEQQQQQVERSHQHEQHQRERTGGQK
jgi:hypothetical protein